MRHHHAPASPPPRSPRRVVTAIGALFALLAFLGSSMAVAVTEAGIDAAAPSPLGAASSIQSQALTQTALALIFVVLLIIGGAWLLRRVGRFNRSADGAMKIVSVLSLGSRERVVLLQVGRSHQVLVGVAPGRVSALRDFADGVELDHPARGDGEGLGRFATVMKTLREASAARATDNRP